MTTSNSFSGVYTALITPFKDGAIDYRSFVKLIQVQLEAGIDGFVINGTTAECPTLTKFEAQKLLEVAQSEVAGSVPIIMGTGTNCTATTIEYSHLARKWKADGALVVTPYYNKPPQRGLFQHFKGVAEATDLPIILYNVPSRTVTGLTVETVCELSHISNIVGIKEATGDIGFGKQILAKCNKDFLLTSGDDATCVDMALAGGRGVISVISHVIPSELKALMKSAAANETGASSEYIKFNQLVHQLFMEVNPIPVKMALYLMGIIASPELRLPLVQLSNEATTTLKNTLMELGLCQ